MHLVAADVVAERKRQEAEWGQQDHDPAGYFAIMAEEFGEVAEAVVHLTFGGPLKLKNGTVLTTKEEITKHYITELVHCSAVCQAMIERELRRKIYVVGGVTRETAGPVTDLQRQVSPDAEKAPQGA